MNNDHPQHFHGLDHLRALAITLVFLFHYFILSGGQPTWLPQVAKFGWTGVDLFFVLSGFLIASQLFQPVAAGQQPSYRAFFSKRFFRILPAYFFTLFIYFSLPAFREKEALPPVWRFLSFTQNLGLNPFERGTFSHAWSLCVEEHFYLLLPLSLALIQACGFLKRAGLFLLLLFVAGFAFRLYSYEHLYLPYEEDDYSGVYWYKFVYYPTYNRLEGLLVGVSIAALYRFQTALWLRLLRYGYVLMVAGILCLTGAYFLCEEQTSFEASVFGFPLIALGYGLLVLGALSPRIFLYRWRSKIMATVATLSYAVYLTHKGIIHVTRQLLTGFELNENLLLIICLLSCLGFALLVNSLIEKPFIKLGRKFAGRNKPELKMDSGSLS